MAEWGQSEARTTLVDGDTCVFCKLERRKWEASVSGVPLASGEVICSQCLGDVRAYNRYRKFLIVVSDAFAPVARTMVHDAFEELAADLAELYEDDGELSFLPSVYSDAAHTGDTDGG